MKSPLSIQTEKWIKTVYGNDAEIQVVHKLPGATSSSMFNIEILHHQSKYEAVLRLIDNEQWLEEESDLAQHEAVSLRQVVESDVPTPELIAYDSDGSICGVPAVLMSKVAGKVELHPENMNSWLHRLAEALFTVHQVSTEGFAWNYFPYTNINELSIPEWSNEKDLWEQALQIVETPPETVKKAFIHRDFHPANVLWNNGGVSGVVDWVNACIGPVGADLGHCRINLASLYGNAAAEEFLKAYLSIAGSAYHHDPYWDLRSLFDFLLPGPPEVYSGWLDFGITHLTDEDMKERADQYLVQVMKQF